MHQSTRRKLKDDGFTFIESLFQLFVLLIFSQLIAFLYIWFHEIDSTRFNHHESTWELFINELQQYIDQSEEIFLTNKNKMLHLYDSDLMRTTQISRYGDMIRKQVDFEGHVPLLMGVKDIQFEIKNYYITVTVHFLNGKVKERSLLVENVRK